MVALRHAELRRDWQFLSAFYTFYQFVPAALLRGDNLFIHCRAEAHCAGTCAAVYATMAYSLQPCEAAKIVKERRSVT